MGIHAHDNGGLALANSLAGLESGASWVDSTVLGMGRGAGNTRSELLLGHLSQHQGNTADVEDMEILISDYFEPLRRRTQWGPSFQYVTAAAKGIHPTFIQVPIIVAQVAPQWLVLDGSRDELTRHQLMEFQWCSKRSKPCRKGFKPCIHLVLNSHTVELKAEGNRHQAPLASRH